jgi:hypothetical protein
MAKRAKKQSIEMVIESIRIGTLRAFLLGTSALIMHRFSKKAREELLLPRGDLNKAEKAEHLKHDPLAEFRESIYRNRDENTPTFIHFPSGAFGKAMASTALDIPGATKAQMARLTNVVSTQVNLYGVPQLYMAMVRNSDMNHTPDIRTRAIFPEWACELEAEFVATLIKEGQFANLLAAAGRIRGIGDWRPEKGGMHGMFRIATEDDPELRRVMREGGREAQIAAYTNPKHYDYETEELMVWFKEECIRREKPVPSDSFDIASLAAVVATKKSNGKGRRGRSAAHR